MSRIDEALAAVVAARRATTSDRVRAHLLRAEAEVLDARQIDAVDDGPIAQSGPNPPGGPVPPNKQ